MPLRRIRQRPTKRRPKDTPDRPHQGHDTKGPRLQFPLRHHLRHRGPDDAHIAVPQPRQRPRDDGPRQRRREAEEDARRHRAHQAGQDGRFAADPVGHAAPDDAREALAQREDGRGDAGPVCDFGPGHVEAFDHLGLRGLVQLGTGAHMTPGVLTR